MRKNDFWTLSLVAFLIMAVSFGWNIWLKIVVILNSLVVLWDVFYSLYKRGRLRG